MHFYLWRIYLVFKSMHSDCCKYNQLLKFSEGMIINQSSTEISQELNNIFYFISATFVIRRDRLSKFSSTDTFDKSTQSEYTMYPRDIIDAKKYAMPIILSQPPASANKQFNPTINVSNKQFRYLL